MQRLPVAPVYPFTTKLAWHLKGRPAHIIAAAEAALPKFGAKRRDILVDRIFRLRRILIVQMVVMAFLYAGIIAAVVAWVTQQLGVAADLADTLGQVAQLAGSASGLLFGLLLLVRRRIGQLEADLVMVVALRGT